MNHIQRNRLADRRSARARSLLAFLVALVGSCATGCKPRTDGMTAQYPNLTLTFGPAQSSLLYRLRTGLPKKDATVEPLYVELQDGRTFLLSELPLDVIKPLCADAYSTKKAIGEVLVYQDVLDSWGSSRGQFIFHNDQLVEVNLVTSPGAIVQKIALSEDGPYVPLAMSREQMEEMFGKPDKWQEYRYQRGP